MTPIFSRVVVLVADGVGCGEAPDAADYGDTGADTLGNIARGVGQLHLPHLGALGLGHLTAIAGVEAAPKPRGAFGKMREVSAGKDTMTGHWEMAGLVTENPLALFPHGFPGDLMASLRAATGRDFVGNKPASGTAILDELGAEHLRSGRLILYTSGDSVLQIAAHERLVPVGELYRICEAARLLCDRYRIGRVIARPFVGEEGAFRRTYNRKDFSMRPPRPTVLDALQKAGLSTIGVGKIGDIFSMRGLDRNIHTEGNGDGFEQTLALVGERRQGLLLVNFVDFDTLYGHRNDAPGFADCLAEFDRFLPRLEQALDPGDLVLITADHGNDPTLPSTDHSREYVPLLAFGPRVLPSRPLGIRRQFCDIAQTLAHNFGLAPWPVGESFLSDLAA